MPGRKSGVSVVSNGGDDASEITAAPRAPKETKDKNGLSVEDISLPRSMINRLAKGVLPANTQIGKDALLALHKSATVFVSYIASNSNDLAHAGGKKTIMPADVLAALKDAEFEGFLPRLEAELKKYNDTQCDKRNNYRRKIKEEKAAAAAKDGTSTDVGEDATDLSIAPTANGHTERNGNDDGERPFKKFRASDGGAVVSRDLADDDDDDGDDDQDDGNDQEDDSMDDDDGPDDEGDEVFEDAAENVNADDTMEDVDDTFAGRRREPRDEALDEPDSD